MSILTTALMSFITVQSYKLTFQLKLQLWIMSNCSVTFTVFRNNLANITQNVTRLDHQLQFLAIMYMWSSSMVPVIRKFPSFPFPFLSLFLRLCQHKATCLSPLFLTFGFCVSLHCFLQGEPGEDDLLPPVGQEGAIPQLRRRGSATQKWLRWEHLLFNPSAV